MLPLSSRPDEQLELRQTVREAADGVRLSGGGPRARGLRHRLDADLWTAALPGHRRSRQSDCPTTWVASAGWPSCWPSRRNSERRSPRCRSCRSTVLCGQVLAGCGEPQPLPGAHRGRRDRVARAHRRPRPVGRGRRRVHRRRGHGHSTVRFAPFGASAGFFVVAAPDRRGRRRVRRRGGRCRRDRPAVAGLLPTLGDGGAQHGTGGPDHDRRAGASAVAAASTSPCSR